MGSIRKCTLKSKISSVLLNHKTLPNQSGKGYQREKFPLPSRQFTEMTFSLSNSNFHHFLQWSVLLSENFFQITLLSYNSLLGAYYHLHIMQKCTFPSYCLQRNRRLMILPYFNFNILEKSLSYSDGSNHVRCSKFVRSKAKIGCSSSIANRWTCSLFVRCSKYCSTNI